MHLLPCLLFLISFDLSAAQQKSVQKKKKIEASHAQQIGEELTRTNALFPRSETSAENARTLFIMLDDADAMYDEIEAPTIDTLTVLIQRAGPLLVSKNLLHNIFKWQIDPRPLQEVEKALKSGGGILDRSIYGRAIVQLLLKAFNPQEWLIAIPADTDALYVLIPRWYIEEKKKMYKGTPFDLDLCMGLRLSGMKEVSDDRAAWSKRWKPQALNEEFQAGKVFHGQVTSGKLFVTDQEYLKKGIIPPQWTFVLMGHGVKDELITDMSLPHFEDFFAFISKKLVTKLLFYESCYASGSNKKAIYKDSLRVLGHDTYAFPIVSVGSSESPVSHASPEFTYSNGPGVTFFVDYRKFVNLVEQSTPVAYTELLMPIIFGFDAFTKNFGGSPYPLDPKSISGNYPLIRLPHHREFQPILPTVEITEHMVVGRGMGKDPIAPLDINNYAQQKIAQQLNLPLSKIDFASEMQRLICVLLSAQYIPFQVDLIDRSYDPKKQYRPLMISTLVGDTPKTSLHIFQTIKTNYPFNISENTGILSIFSSVEYATQRTYLIRKLTVIEEDKGKKEETEYTNVLIHFQPNPEQITTYYTLSDGITYKSIFPASAKTIKEDYLESYAGAIAAVEKQYEDELKKVSVISGAITKVIKDPAEVKKRSNAMLEAREAAEEAEKKKKQRKIT